MTTVTPLRFAVMAALALILAACVSTPTKFTGNVPVRDVSQEAVGLINKFRASNGLPPVMVDPSLVEAARYQAVAMASANVLSHEIGGDFTRRMNSAGFYYANAAENVGAGHTSVEDAINAWIRSPHHHENMLMKDATRIGMVVADAPNSRYRNYWALDLASTGAGASPAPKVVAAKAPAAPSVSGISMFFQQ